MQLTLYTDVDVFYTGLIAALDQAQTSITMLYYTYDYGEWTLKISTLLQAKQAAGVAVRLVVDEVGLAIDSPGNAIKNRLLLNQLSAAGVTVHFFRPRQRRTSHFNRLHFKLCNIDRATTFVGGSNIGDDYVRMDDLNLRLDGDVESAIDDLYGYLVGSQQPQGLSPVGQPNISPIHLSSLRLGNIPLLLTLPGSRQDIRRALLGLILDAREYLTIRTWLFLPDREIVNALLHQCELGCRVKLLFSDRTRIGLIDRANTIIAHRLVAAGAQVWRYTPGFMHAKAAWNDRGQVLFGSANLDSKALNNNYECCLFLQNSPFAQQLQNHFDSGITCGSVVGFADLSAQRWSEKLTAYAALWASNWL